jgi:WD40 repeat protein
MTVSSSGKYLASGQKTHMGFQADIIIWDFDSLQAIQKLKLHKVLIQSLSFSFDERHLASLGGQDDNQLVIWNIESGRAICGNPVGTSTANQIRFFNNTDSKLLCIYNYGVKIWSVDLVAKKIQFADVNLGHIKRVFTTCIIDQSDSFAYLGTKTGDIVEISLERLLFKRIGPAKRLFSQGINCINTLPNGDLLVGAGDGLVAKVGGKDMLVKSEHKVMGAVTSISPTADSTHVFVGTSKATIYWADTDQLKAELRNTCHFERINSVSFPYAYSELFVTSSVNDIRVWNAKTRQELLRIEVPGLECYCTKFMNDGKSLVTGWSDGKIRAFLPQSGKLFYAINDAHNHGVTALALTNSCDMIVSGGMEGEVRIWRVGKQTQIMEASMKEHRGRVSDIKISKNDAQAVSASFDGSAIIWDIRNHTRVMCFFESTMFKQVVFHPDES